MSERKELDRLYQETKSDLLCNTSYPYHPEYFKEYLSDEDIMDGVEELSLYFHIPFCKSLCSFCEYTRFLPGGEEQEERYLDLLEKQVDGYFTNHNTKLLYGLDIGGGTPSCLSEKNMEKLFEMITEKIGTILRVDDFESSFEFNYESINHKKIEILGRYDVSRVSTGVQIYDTNIMDLHNRKISRLEKMLHINEQFRKEGIKKINLDIMYGFPNQDRRMLASTIHAIKLLDVDQITLYEMRYNQNGISSGTVNRESLYDQYCYLYDQLTFMGYLARFGQNTFSKFEDEGVSSYLRYRMRKGVAYKGFGVSAQSMSWNGISYNSLKGNTSSEMPYIDEILERDSYKLPPEEIVAKYVSISLYNGCFDLDTITKMIGNDAKKVYNEELEYLLDKKYIQLVDRMVYVTEIGFKYYAVVAAFFWSKSHRAKYLERKRV